MFDIVFNPSSFSPIFFGTKSWNLWVNYLWSLFFGGISRTLDIGGLWYLYMLCQFFPIWPVPDLNIEKIILHLVYITCKPSWYWCAWFLKRSCLITIRLLLPCWMVICVLGWIVFSLQYYLFSCFKYDDWIKTKGWRSSTTGLMRTWMIRWQM